MVQKKIAKNPLASKNTKQLCIQAINIYTGEKPAGKSQYDLLKYIFATVKMNRSSSDRDVFSWIHKACKYFLPVEKYNILMETHNRICLGKLIKRFETLFDYTYQEGNN